MDGMPIPVGDEMGLSFFGNEDRIMINRRGARYASMCPDVENCDLGYICLVSGSCPLLGLEYFLEEISA